MNFQITNALMATTVFGKGPTERAARLHRRHRP